MSIINLKGYKVLTFDFKGILTPGQKITLQNTCSYNVRYSKEGICVGKLSCNVSDKEHSNDFYVKLELEGAFSFDPAVSREEIHVATFKELFPYARSIVTSATAVFGITPIFIPQVDIEGQNIYRIDADNIK